MNWIVVPKRYLLGISELRFSHSRRFPVRGTDAFEEKQPPHNEVSHHSWLCTGFIFPLTRRKTCCGVSFESLPVPFYRYILIHSHCAQTKKSERDQQQPNATLYQEKLPWGRHGIQRYPRCPSQRTHTRLVTAITIHLSKKNVFLTCVM